MAGIRRTGRFSASTALAGGRLPRVSRGKLDADASTYIRAVEAADGQRLEQPVRDAINAFVVGCKADGIWAPLKAACILAGARTLTGALVPLVGAAPSSVSFVSGDYSRSTGLVGNGSTKYLDANRAANADPESNAHLAVFATVEQTQGVTAYLAGASAASANDGMHFASSNSTTPNQWVVRCRMDSVDADVKANQRVGLTGISRSGSANYIFRNNRENTTFTRTASGSATVNHYIYGMNQNGTLTLPSAARLAFYSIGEAVDLALLDTRVTNLIGAIAAALA